MPQSKKYYDDKKYAIAAETPNRWSQVTPELGFKEFNKEYLTNEDCEALIKAASPYVTLKSGQ